MTIDEIPEWSFSLIVIIDISYLDSSLVDGLSIFIVVKSFIVVKVHKWGFHLSCFSTSFPCASIILLFLLLHHPSSPEEDKQADGW